MQRVETPSATTGSAQRVRFPWIISARRDLALIIGAAAFGWAYVATILLVVGRVGDPLREPVLTLGPWPVTLTLLVVMSWGLLLDAPHLWATYARTFFDPAERAERGAVFRRSWAWFAVGPAVILAPYVAAAIGLPVPAGWLGVGALAFFLVWSLLGYHHNVRQHWGFFSLYRRKGGPEEADDDSVDRWAFHLLLYLPLAVFATAPFYSHLQPLPPDGWANPLLVPEAARRVGLDALMPQGMAIAGGLHALALAAFALVAVGYAAHQVRRWSRGLPLNGSKLLYLALVAPLHLAAVSHPLLALFFIPITTIGHNIQYHGLVYAYGRKKYTPSEGPDLGLARLLFSNVGLYFAFGLAFALLVHQGPLVEAFKRAASGPLATVLGPLVPAGAGSAAALVAALLASLFLGFSLQHYHLDAHIWRVGRDESLRRHLGA